MSAVANAASANAEVSLTGFFYADEEPADEAESTSRKTIEDPDTGHLMIQEEDGTITRPKEGVLPATWKTEWGPVDMQAAELRLAEFKNQGKALNKNRQLPHGRDLCVCIGVSEEDDEEANRCEALYLEMRKDWKKQFPKSTKHNDVPFHEYEAMVLADLYEEAYGKFLAQADLHDKGHKPTDRLEHFKAYSEKKRKKYNEMKQERIDRADLNRKNRKEAALKRAREAPAKKADATAKMLADGIAAHKKTEAYKTEHKNNQTRIRDLLKQYMGEGMEEADALDKAMEEVLG